MKQKLIDISVVIAEIEKRRKEWQYGSSIEAKYKKEECDDILSFLSTIEVKEVDLEKEIEEYAYSLPHGTTGSCFYVSDKRLPIARKFGIKHDWDYVAVENIAEHFFELGLKAQKEL